MLLLAAFDTPAAMHKEQLRYGRKKHLQILKGPELAKVQMCRWS